MTSIQLKENYKIYIFIRKQNKLQFQFNGMCISAQGAGANISRKTLTLNIMLLKSLEKSPQRN